MREDAFVYSATEVVEETKQLGFELVGNVTEEIMPKDVDVLGVKGGK